MPVIFHRTESKERVIRGLEGRTRPASGSSSAAYPIQPARQDGPPAEKIYPQDQFRMRLAGGTIRSMTQKLAFTCKRKKAKPRGKPFEPGNGIGNRFKAGEVTNPTGSNGRPYTEAHRLVAGLPTSELDAIDTDPVAVNVAKAIAREALEGNVRAAAELRESIEGKSTQRHELTGAEGGPVKISHEEFVRNIKKIYGLHDPS